MYDIITDITCIDLCRLIAFKKCLISIYGQDKNISR